MRVVLLLEKRLEPVPDTIKVEECFDEHLTIIVGGLPGPTGKHVVLSGTPKDFADWLGKFDEFWLGAGSCVMEQRFKLSFVLEEAKQ